MLAKVNKKARPVKPLEQEKMINLMNRRNFLNTLAGGVILASIGSCTNANAIVSADSLIVDIDKYARQKVKTEGLISHVCSYNGKKMKLKSDNGEVIVIIPHDNSSFDHSLNGKRISVYGLVKEERLSKSYIDERERLKSLLCHVDQRPCKDTDWVKSKIESGVAESISKKDIETLRQKMEKQGKGYVSIVSIVCEQYSVIEENV